LDTYIIINFRTLKINRDTRNLIQISTLIKKIKPARQETSGDIIVEILIGLIAEKNIKFLNFQD
jgi:hypothetical protein